MNIIEWKHRINYNDCYILIVPNMAAGKKPRYTVYKIPSSEAGKIKIIGRELNIKTARKIAREYENDVSKDIKRILKRYDTP